MVRTGSRSNGKVDKVTTDEDMDSIRYACQGMITIVLLRLVLQTAGRPNLIVLNALVSRCKCSTMLQTQDQGRAASQGSLDQQQSAHLERRNVDDLLA